MFSACGSLVIKYLRVVHIFNVRRDFHGCNALMLFILTHWGWVTHICISNLTAIGSDNCLSPEWHQAIVWTNAGILLIGILGTNVTEISSEIHTFSLKKMHLKMSSAEWHLFRLSLNELTDDRSYEMNWRIDVNNLHDHNCNWVADVCVFS